MFPPWLEPFRLFFSPGKRNEVQFGRQLQQPLSRSGTQGFEGGIGLPAKMGIDDLADMFAKGPRSHGARGTCVKIGQQCDGFLAVKRTVNMRLRGLDKHGQLVRCKGTLNYSDGTATNRCKLCQGFRSVCTVTLLLVCCCLLAPKRSFLIPDSNSLKRIKLESACHQKAIVTIEQVGCKVLTCGIKNSYRHCQNSDRQIGMRHILLLSHDLLRIRPDRLIAQHWCPRASVV